MEIKKILEAFCAPLQIDADELFDTLKGEKNDIDLNDETLEKITGAVKDQIVAANSETSKRFTRIAYTEYIKEARKLGIEVPKTATAADVIRLISDHLSVEPPGNPGEITEEVAAKHPVFKSLVAKHTAKMQEQIEAIQKEHNDYKTTIERQTLKSAYESKAAKILREKNCILQTDSVKEEDRLNVIFQMLGSKSLRHENGEILVIDPETDDILRDGLGKPVTFEKIVVETGSIFGFHKQSPDKGGSGGGRNPETPGKGGAYNFQDRAAFDKAYSQSTDPAERAKMSQAYFDANPEG